MMVEPPFRYGSVRIKLQDLLDRNNLSKNKLGQYAQMQRTQINQYCGNNLSRVDLDVIARICKVFNCTISDVLEYIPPDETGVTEVKE